MFHSNVLSFSGDEDKNDFSSTFDQEMTGRAATMFDWSREKNPQEKERKIENCVTVVRRCLQHRQLVNISCFYLILHHHSGLRMENIHTGEYSDVLPVWRYTCNKVNLDSHEPTLHF